MKPGKNLDIRINPKGSTEVIIRLPDDEGRRHPCFTALVHFYQSQKTEMPIQAFCFVPTFDIEYFWNPLLKEKRLPSPLDFPPEMLDSLMITFEIQACKMLTHYAIVNDLNITIQMVQPNEAGLIQNILSDSSDRRTLTDHALIKNNIEISSPAQIVESALEHYLQAYSFEDSDRAFMAWLYDEHSYFEDTKIDTLSKSLWFAKIEDSDTPQTVKDKCEQYFVDAYTFKNDCILEDVKFIQSLEDPRQKLHAELLLAYSHLKCGLYFHKSVLKKLLADAEDQNLKYWVAYLRTYGHVVRSFNGELNLTYEFKEFLKGYQLYKSLYDLIGITRIYHAKASLLIKADRHQSGIRLLSISENIRGFLQDQFGVAKVQNGIAYAYLQIDDWENALRSHIRAIKNLESSKKHTELAFTYSQIAWLHLLKGEYPTSVDYGQKTIDLMEEKKISTLSFRTKPDLHAQLGLSLFFNGQFDDALQQSDFCEAHKVDSSPTGEILRTLLQALINDHREESHLADLSFNYLPELLKENSEIDAHIEPVYLRALMNRFYSQEQDWRANNTRKQGLALCQVKGLHQTAKWFHADET